MEDYSNNYCIFTNLGSNMRLLIAMDKSTCEIHRIGWVNVDVEIWDDLETWNPGSGRLGRIENISGCVADGNNQL